MTRNEAYKHAEVKIEEARLSGEKKLDLSARWDAKDSQQLTELPESLGQLTRLQTMDLSGNQLTELPESLGQLMQLQTLYLSRNQLTVLPDWLGQLTELQELDLSRNQLAELPESLGQLTQLWALKLSNNRLTVLPESLDQLTQLQTLLLAGNQLKELPESLGHFKQLQLLDLSNNRLTELPESVGRLTQLRVLSLYVNRLTELPDELGKLTQLRALRLERNRIERIPRWIGQLKQLTRLYLGYQGSERGNPLVDLPIELRDLTKLEILDVSNCPNLNLAPEIVAKRHSPREILDYYFSTRGDRGSALRELKLIVVGRGGAGKTSLVKRLNRQPLDPTESETHGINISPLKLMCHDGPVTARVWDFGGQHVLHAMHEFFLTARSLYLLVIGEREDMAERDAAYWLQLIRSYAGSAPVVVALNKNAGRPREMDRESLERNYGPILAWVPTECSDGFDETIENLRAALNKAADGIKEVRNLFPAKWWNVKEWLENMDEPYLDFARYQERCRELGEQDPQQQERLASWLNDLGIAINYANDERLHDTTVLRPDWLANGIYAILRANDPHHEQPHAPDATLTSMRLGPIYAGAEKLKMLKAADYPETKWSFLLQLMKLFQLAFPIDDTGKKLLVATLLPVEPPPDCDEPDAEDRTRLRYEFAVVPGPLLPKLLVRTFSLIDAERRWRRGAMLRFGQARARVWTTQDERWVRITAVGEGADRKELVTMVRVTLRKLIAEYRNLQAVEQWEYEGEWVPRRTLERMGVLSPDDDSNDGEEVQP
jgi:Leucine-rich repeat (LRR) protein